MEGRERKSITSNRTVCISDTELSEASLKEEESVSTIDEERFTGSCELPRRIELSSFYRGGCSKSCTEHKEIVAETARTSDCEPQTLRESSPGEKKPETKPWTRTPLSDQVKTKLKGTSGKLQNVLPFFEKTSRRTLGRIKSFYASLKGDLKDRRALGFKCDLKKCDSTLMECSAGSCKKESMIFGGPAHPYHPEDPFDSSASDISVKSSTERMGGIPPS